MSGGVAGAMARGEAAEEQCESERERAIGERKGRKAEARRAEEEDEEE